ncbi:preprotein translocase subunit YajC [Pseudobacteroides cellulosolvens]|uniref:Preprotein translocase, YajC subunit n=1 Tax=Pseudobacteroides cellulosolvens ATCC 35603 = DSM 2933 TaxID=398512 RepID=A0A0L6JJ14_9FIRM|nr:preprotein translocase subunit YajC [Pseudobacteroides cellulosolvens]KNY25442.1 preprotein translocase, YajC subunit [Pseudobacteroides cellulosolvens ATCC 35603 = DSM 2933]
MEAYSSLIMIIPMIAVFYFMIILPQKKRDKKTREMLNALNVGENIITIGGVVGKIINIKDDELTIETSIKRTEIVIMRWAVKEVLKSADI